MSASPPRPETHEIVVEEILPHAPAAIWRALTTGALIDRWLMQQEGFAPVPGTHFTLRTTPAGAWDGLIRCEVLDVIENQRLAYSWRGGHDGNPGYGSRLDTVVTLTLEEVAGGTRLRVVHSGFVLPRNASSYRTLGEGWRKVAGRIGTVAGEGLDQQS